jgi:hypothetical protein
MCKVLIARRVSKRSAPDRVYVGRPSKWGSRSFDGLRVPTKRPNDPELHRRAFASTTSQNRSEKITI